MGTAKGSLEARAKSGRVFPVDVSLSPLRTGGAALVVVTLRETTEQRRAEAQQRALEQQLRQAQKMDALGTLAGGIAHDFNNLLTVILGNTELATRTKTPEENLDAIREAGLRSKDLVAQILTFSRRTEVERVPVRLQTVIDDALKLLRSTIPVMVRIDHFIDAHCPPVLADPTQIHQVLMNLCTNAWHALPERDGVIEVRLQPTLVEGALAAVNPDLTPGPHVRLSVSDNGHGMSAGTLERIYEPFFTTKAVGKGTGLGLAMVHGIVKEHAGAIFVRSEPGKGTTFELYFPALPNVEMRAPEAPAEGAAGAGERVLYVDDDQLVGDALAELLSLMGFKTTHKLDPRAALALFESGPQEFDLLITDRAMPGMTGGELAAKVLRIRPEIPVLLLTGYADPAMEKELLAIGVREILGKPLSAQKLGEAVRRALDQRKTKRA
jgi:signal transduction histidine kinase/ActR/RegA family two-component response regulator